MKQILMVLAAVWVSQSVVLAGTPKGADRITKEFRLAELEWKQQWLTAKTDAEKVALLGKQPNPAEFSKRMVAEIGDSLHQKWSMPYIVWLLQHHASLTEKEVGNLIGFVEKYHMDSPQLGEFCVVLAPAGVALQALTSEAVGKKRPNLTLRKISFMESIIESKRSEKLRGQACLGLSSVLSQMGDAPELNKRRLDLIRKAVINSAEMKIGDHTVAELATEELYCLTKLSKGATAPELDGRDSSLQPLKLSDFRGKFVVLVFWNSREQATEVLEYLRKLEQTYAGQNVQILGVNRDSLTTLREMEIAKQTVGKNFSDPRGELYQIYRVRQAPACYVLDTQGVIQYNGQLGSFVDFTLSALLAPKTK